MDTEEYQKVFERMRDKLFRISLRIVNNVAIAEDVVQEVLIKLWKTKERVAQIENVDGWCVVMTRNLSIDKLRVKRNQTQSLDNVLHMSDKAPIPDRVTENRDLMQTIRQVITKLPEKQKSIFQLRDIEGMTYKEISEIMSISLEDVKVNLHRARKKIKHQLITVESYGL